VAPVAHDLGLPGIIVSDEADAETARQAGFSDVRIGRAHHDVPATGPSAYGLADDARPVLTLEAEVVAVKQVPAGAGVSYGYTYRTTRGSTLALVGLGYSDGVPRLASNRAQVLVAGTPHPLVGRIAMDQLVVDCGDGSPVVGERAVLFGDTTRGEPSARDWATWTERMPLALTAGLGARIRREAR